MKRSVIRDHTGAEWEVADGVATAVKPGILRNAEPRAHLVQEKQWESPQMRDVGGQRYQSDAPGTRSASGRVPPRPRAGGIPAVEGRSRRKAAPETKGRTR
jgi:hypothetical protein